MLLLLAHHLSGKLVLFLLLKEFNHCHLLSGRVTFLILLIIGRLTTRVELLIDCLNLELLVSSRSIQDRFLERNNRVTDLEFDPWSVVSL